MDAQINIKWKHIDKYIQTPIVGLFDFKIKKSGVDNTHLKSFKGQAAYMPNKNLDLLAKTYLPLNFREYSLDYADAFFMEICTNEFYFKKLAFYKLVSQSTIDLALKKQFHNVKEKEKNIFRVGFEVGGNMLNRIWQPHRDLQSLIDSYINQMFNFSETFVIGIQMRYGSKWTMKYQSDAIFLGRLFLFYFWEIFIFKIF